MHVDIPKTFLSTEVHSMQALKLRLYQTQAVYRNPISSEVIETYPLPPPSTILGLISTLIRKPLDAKDINISIAGTFDTLVRDYQWYKKHSTTKPYPILVHLLQDVHLTIHITTYDNLELMTQIKNAFECPPSFLYLGRAEDLFKIESVDNVDLILKKPSKMDTFKIDESIYIAEKDLKKITTKGIPYWLATFMHPDIITIENNKKQESKLLRNFDWILYNYFEKNTSIGITDDISLHHDGEQYIWWSLQSQTQ